MFLRLFFVLGISCIISSCTTGITVATTGAQAVYDRHTLKQKMTDNYITMQAYRKIYTDTHRYDGTNIAVATFHNEVLLTGEASQINQIREVEQIVKDIPNVNEVHNHLSVAGVSSTLTSASDSWITAKIKAKLIAIDEVDPSQIKVVTENGTVYLMGIVFPEQAETAAEVAAETAGVQEVIKHFSYLRISKT